MSSPSNRLFRMQLYVCPFCESGEGRAWLVTGTSSGFGRAIARAALSRGDTVVGTATRAGRPDDLIRGAAPEGKAHALPLELTHTEGTGRAEEEVFDRFGRVDVLVNSAGHGQVGALEGFSEALPAEVAPMGVRVLVVLPGAFRTGFAGGGLVGSRAFPGYRATLCPAGGMIEGINGTQPGDPAGAAEAILPAPDAEDTPRRLPLGADAVAAA